MENTFKEALVLPVKDTDKIQSICSGLVSQVADKRSGVSQEDLEWLKTERRDYRALRSFYYKVRKGERPPKKRSEELEAKGLSIDKVSEDETFIASELLDALHSTFVYIDKTDPKATREKTGQQDLGYVNVATKANIEFADFFIKVHQRFNLKDEDLYNLFDLLFEKAGITQELEAKGLDHFPGGVLAAVRAYLHLSSQLPDWQLRVPEVELDRDHSVDLIAESKDKKETRYFEIKGRRDTKEVEVTEITEEQKMERLRENIILNTSNDKDRNVKLISLYKLFDFTRSQIKGGNKAKAFWVEVPSTV